MLMVLSEEIDQSSNSIVIWLIRDNQITIQISCFLIKFDSLTTSSNETLSHIKQQMQQRYEMIFKTISTEFLLCQKVYRNNLG